MSEQPTAERQQLAPAAAEAVRAYAAKKREAAETVAAVLEDIAANGCRPWRTASRGRLNPAFE